jgi:hypothetical protein
MYDKIIIGIALSAFAIMTGIAIFSMIYIIINQ